MHDKQNFETTLWEIRQELVFLAEICKASEMGDPKQSLYGLGLILERIELRLEDLN